MMSNRPLVVVVGLLWVADYAAGMPRSKYLARDPWAVTRRLKGGKENWEVRRRYERSGEELKVDDYEGMEYASNTMGKPEVTFDQHVLDELMMDSVLGERRCVGRLGVGGRGRGVPCVTGLTLGN